MFPAEQFVIASPAVLNDLRPSSRGNQVFGQSTVPQSIAEPDTATKAFTPRNTMAETGLSSGTDDNHRAAVTRVVTVADLDRKDLGGFRLGSFELGSRIGHGGMGQVFQAKHTSLGKTFAIKFLAAEVLTNSEAKHRFQEEIASLGQLQHPNIVSAVDAGVLGGVCFLATEYVDGVDLGRHVSEHGPLPFHQTLGLVKQVAAGLAHAHSYGFIHRDIKPSNIILDSHGTVRILDFGLVRKQEQADGLTSAGQLLGTIDFLSPEQAADGRIADCRSDLYSLGCTILFLLTGRLPFSGEQFASSASKIHGHMFSIPPALEVESPEIPKAFRALLLRLTAKRPSDRFQSAEELIHALIKVGEAGHQHVADSDEELMPAIACLASKVAVLSGLHSTVRRRKTMAGTGCVIAVFAIAGLWKTVAFKFAAPPRHAATVEAATDVSGGQQPLNYPGELSSQEVYTERVVNVPPPAESTPVITADFQSAGNADGFRFGPSGKIFDGVTGTRLFDNRKAIEGK